MLLDAQIIINAVQGDEKARVLVLQHYDGYINEFSRISVLGVNGRKNTVIDEDIKAELQAKLLKSLSGFSLEGGYHHASH